MIRIFSYRGADRRAAKQPEGIVAKLIRRVAERLRVRLVAWRVRRTLFLDPSHGPVARDLDPGVAAEWARIVDRAEADAERAIR